MTETQFWAEIELANNSPRLYRAFTEFARFINTRTDFYSEAYEEALRHYFGMNGQQISAWRRYARARTFRWQSINRYYRIAVELTFDTHGLSWPGLFEQAAIRDQQKDEI